MAVRVEQEKKGELQGAKQGEMDPVRVMEFIHPDYPGYIVVLRFYSNKITTTIIDLDGLETLIEERA